MSEEDFGELTKLIYNYGVVLEDNSPFLFQPIEQLSGAPSACFKDAKATADSAWDRYNSEKNSIAITCSSEIPSVCTYDLRIENNAEMEVAIEFDFPNESSEEGELSDIEEEGNKFSMDNFQREQYSFYIHDDVIDSYDGRVASCHAVPYWIGQGKPWDSVMFELLYREQMRDFDFIFSREEMKLVYSKLQPQCFTYQKKFPFYRILDSRVPKDVLAAYLLTEVSDRPLFHLPNIDQDRLYSSYHLALEKLKKGKLSYDSIAQFLKRELNSIKRVGLFNAAPVGYYGPLDHLATARNLKVSFNTETIGLNSSANTPIEVMSEYYFCIHRFTIEQMVHQRARTRRRGPELSQIENANLQLYSKEVYYKGVSVHDYAHKNNNFMSRLIRNIGTCEMSLSEYIYGIQINYHDIKSAESKVAYWSEDKVYYKVRGGFNILLYEHDQKRVPVEVICENKYFYLKLEDPNILYMPINIRIIKRIFTIAKCDSYFDIIRERINNLPSSLNLKSAEEKKIFIFPSDFEVKDYSIYMTSSYQVAKDEDPTIVDLEIINVRNIKILWRRAFPIELAKPYYSCYMRSGRTFIMLEGRNEVELFYNEFPYESYENRVLTTHSPRVASILRIECNLDSYLDNVCRYATNVKSADELYKHICLHREDIPVSSNFYKVVEDFDGNGVKAYIKSLFAPLSSENPEEQVALRIGLILCEFVGIITDIHQDNFSYTHFCEYNPRNVRAKVKAQGSVFEISHRNTKYTVLMSNLVSTEVYVQSSIKESIERGTLKRRWGSITQSLHKRQKIYLERETELTVVRSKEAEEALDRLVACTNLGDLPEEAGLLTSDEDEDEYFYYDSEDDLEEGELE